MSGVGRRVRAAVNPVSTAATRWWCHSAIRHMLTGYGAAARPRRLTRRGDDPERRPSAEQMKERAEAIDQLFDHGQHLLGQDTAAP
jgi:hypothetical protein